MVWPCLTGSMALHIGLARLHLSPLTRIFQEKFLAAVTIMRFPSDCLGDWGTHEGEREIQTPGVA